MNWPGNELGPRRREADWYFPEPWFSHVIENEGGVLLDIIACDILTCYGVWRKWGKHGEYKGRNCDRNEEAKCKRNSEEKDRMDERREL